MPRSRRLLLAAVVLAIVAAAVGWPLTLAVMALGPAFGIRALRRVWGRGPRSGQAPGAVKENRPGAG